MFNQETEMVTLRRIEEESEEESGMHTELIHKGAPSKCHYVLNFWMSFQSRDLDRVLEARLHSCHRAPRDRAVTPHCDRVDGKPAPKRHHCCFQPQHQPSQIQFSRLARDNACGHGDRSRRQAAQEHQVPSGIQPKGGYAKGQCPGDEKVGKASNLELRGKRQPWKTAANQAIAAPKQMDCQHRYHHPWK